MAMRRHARANQPTSSPTILARDNRTLRRRVFTQLPHVPIPATAPVYACFRGLRVLRHAWAAQTSPKSAPAAHQRWAAGGSPDGGGITRDGRRVQHDHPQR
ncbi:hypothetical protein K525DRAFT_275146 [Schizophyllum commune Loenen D]|nr:hypothetical protein K525DRAFT_275146 [Schizophyllum commune Loenen D]